MEGFDHKEYRDQLAKNIKDAPKEDRGSILGGQKNYNAEYNLAWVQHQKEKMDLAKERLETDDLVDSINMEFADNNMPHNGWVEAFTVGSLLEDEDEIVSSKKMRCYVEMRLPEERERFLETMRLFKDALPDSTLIDLGCGDVDSVPRAYQFARSFGCKKYIGVNGNFETRGTPISVKELKELVIEKADGLEEGDTQLEILHRDMLESLATRTARSNFMLNGIDGYIMPNIEDYKNQLFSHIARLTPPDGIVFGVNCPYLGRLQGYGFQKMEHLTKRSGAFGFLEIWRKIDKNN